MRIFTVLIVLLLVSCADSKVTSNGVEKSATISGTSCQLIQKPFIKKNNVETDIQEYYLRCSIQDYFIKLCESNITRKDLKKYLNNGISVEMEIHEGEWDRCPGDGELQSRIGTYVTISKINN